MFLFRQSLVPNACNCPLPSPLVNERRRNSLLPLRFRSCAASRLLYLYEARTCRIVISLVQGYCSARSMPTSPRTSMLEERTYREASSDISVENTRKEVVIAVDATKDPEESCFEWALANIVEPGDHVTFLGILHRINNPMGYKSQANLSAFRGTNKKTLEQEMEKTLCLFDEKLQPTSDWCKRKGVDLHITITAGSPLKSILLKEADTIKATHLILDRNLRRDKKYYHERLKCILVAFSPNNDVEYLRVRYGPFIVDNPGRSVQKVKAADCFSLVRNIPESLASSATFDTDSNICSEQLTLTGEPITLSAPAWSSNCDDPEFETDFTSTNVLSSSLEDKGHAIFPGQVQNVAATSSSYVPSISCFPDQAPLKSQAEINPLSVQPMRLHPWLQELLKDNDLQSIEDSDANEAEGKLKELHQYPALDREELLSFRNKVTEAAHSNSCRIHEPNPSSTIALIDTMEKFRISFAKPPPLCSICQLKAPELGKATMIFQYKDLKAATNDFSVDNLIAEGGFGLVYKGTFKEELVVAVKVLKASSLQGDVQFSAEVEALSCAQHRNLVRLIGYCIEHDQRALVYEYVCNGSLDRHLSGRSNRTLEWSSRYKIAVGAARGLRYLHEECRAGCIVHRDMRPNNILLTHDFTPMVGDFGLAKLISNGDVAIETQVIGSLGYVAPEYVDCGQVTTKTDVFSFGIVLLELISGRKAVDLSRPKGDISLIEWVKPKLESHQAHDLMDPNIVESVDVYEYNRMVKAASFCIKKDPSNRPGMSQVLRILEGDYDEFRDATSLDVAPISNAIKLVHKNQYQEDINCHQPPEKVEILYRTTREVTTGRRTWLEWVRPYSSFKTGTGDVNG